MIYFQEQDDGSSDPLAEAMAHVHGEYLVGTDEQANVDDMDMVVGQEEASPDVENDASMNSIEEDGEVDGDEDGDGDAEGDGDDSQNIDHEELKRSVSDFLVFLRASNSQCKIFRNNEII